MSRGQCPVCGKPPASPFRPFCSARCADIDLNRWLTGGYSIPDSVSADVENSDERDHDPEG